MHGPEWHKVIGVEQSVGVWVVNTPQFADYMDTIVLPDQLLVLGGTMVIEPDLRADDPRVRVDTFVWIAEQYMRLLAGEDARCEVVVTGLDAEPVEDDLPAGTVF